MTMAVAAGVAQARLGCRGRFGRVARRTPTRGPMLLSPGLAAATALLRPGSPALRRPRYAQRRLSHRLPAHLGWLGKLGGWKAAQSDAGAVEAAQIIWTPSAPLSDCSVKGFGPLRSRNVQLIALPSEFMLSDRDAATAGTQYASDVVPDLVSRLSWSGVDPGPTLPRGRVFSRRLWALASPKSPVREASFRSPSAHQVSALIHSA
jgi:hypothetical protein